MALATTRRMEMRNQALEPPEPGLVGQGVGAAAEPVEPIAPATCPFRLWVLDACGSIADRDLGVLEPSERAQMARFARPADQAAFAKVRASLRRLLGAAVGRDPADLRFSYNPWGRPDLVPGSGAAAPAFSVAHSEGVGLIALALGRPVGVDLERLRPVPERARIAAQLFGAAVASRLAQIPAQFQDLAFMRLWTVAEAYAKARGCGLAGLQEPVPVSLVGGGLESAPVAELQPGRTLFEGAPAMELRAWPVLLPNGFVGSVVTTEWGSEGSSISPERLDASPFASRMGG